MLQKSKSKRSVCVTRDLIEGDVSGVMMAAVYEEAQKINTLPPQYSPRPLVGRALLLYRPPFLRPSWSSRRVPNSYLAHYRDVDLAMTRQGPSDLFGVFRLLEEGGC